MGTDLWVDLNASNSHVLKNLFGDKTFENPVRTSKASVTFSITNPADILIFQEMAVADEGSYHMVIKKESALYWAGRILPENSRARPGPIIILM